MIGPTEVAVLSVVGLIVVGASGVYLYLCVCVCACVCACVCMCVYVCICVYVYVCMCMYVGTVCRPGCRIVWLILLCTTAPSAGPRGVPMLAHSAGKALGTAVR